MNIEGVIMRGVRGKPDSLPSWDYLTTPVAIVPGGALSVPAEELEWGRREEAHVFPWDEANQIARKLTSADCHVYPATVSREEPHPSAHVERAGKLPLPPRAPRDWHAGKVNCGVD